ncbi:MAG TPA: hypothetical protein VMD30_07985, partial [Tepidisphaeraceae bacterium]|nr:hypothetical protein [Tepidisphaeraceae bacterium]
LGRIFGQDMLDEQFEFLLTQYADGTLSADERAALEQRLAGDADARAELETYRRLNAALRPATEPMAAVRWDRLAERISDAIDERTNRPVYSFAWVGRAAAWAAAALVFLAVGAAVWEVSRPAAPMQVARGPSAFMRVVGPVAQPPAGPSVLHISIGQPEGVDLSEYADDSGLVVQRPLVSLAAAGPIGQMIH